MINLTLNSDDLLRYIGELYLDNRSKEDQMANLQNEAEKAVSEISSLKAEIENNKRLLSEQTATIDALRHQIESRQNYISQVEQASYQVAKERDELKKEIEELKKQIDSKQAYNNQLEQTAYQIAKERDELKREVEELKKKLEEVSINVQPDKSKKRN